MEQENCYFLMVPFILDILNMIYLMVKDNQISQMVDNIRVNGKMVQSMGKEYFNGQMEENMMAIMLMMKERDMEFYNGLVDKNIWDFGRKVYFMGMVK